MLIRFLFLRLLPVLVLTISPTRAAVIAADWTGLMTATIGAVDLTITGASGPSIGAADFSGADFSAEPLSATQEALVLDAQSEWSVSLSQPTLLLLYVAVWRGIFAGGPDPVSYTFDHPFTIRSGLGAATVSANTLEVPMGGLHNGIVQFNNVTSLSLTTSATLPSTQALTFAIPEPSSLLLACTALGTLIIRRSRQ